MKKCSVILSIIFCIVSLGLAQSKSKQTTGFENRSFFSTSKNHTARPYSCTDSNRINKRTLSNTNTPLDCVTWFNGTPSDFETIQAANFLCANGLISNNINSFDLGYAVSLNEVCLMLTDILFDPGQALPSDNFPVLQAEIYNLPSEWKRAAKAMLFLDFQDGVTPLNTDHYSFRFNDPCPTQDVLRVVLEAFNIQPYNDGFNKFDDSPSDFYCNVPRNDKNYGYVYRALENGWLNTLTNYNCSCSTCLIEGISRGQFWVLLYDIMQQYGLPGLSEDDFINPNNFSIYNSNSKGDIERGIYTYTQSYFSISTYGLPLDFEIGYYSNLVDYPLFSRKQFFFSDANRENLVIQRITPLGRCWTHTYNIMIQSTVNDNNEDQFLIIRWHDGSTEVYDYQEREYSTKGVYDKLQVTSTNSQGNAQRITIETKQQVKYYFSRDVNDIFNLDEIRDRNNNRIILYYENGAQTPTGTISCGRLRSAYVPNTNVILEFEYQNGTNYLNKVRDNTGREITFDIDKYSETLISSIDAENHETDYRYGNDAQQYLLRRITLPNGNRVDNRYFKRKLSRTTNNQYTATIAFNPSYLSSGTTTQTTVTTQPQNSQSYTTSYNHNTRGRTETIRSATEDKVLRYEDDDNPTLPTQITDNNLNSVERFDYDSRGNVTRHTLNRGGITQTQEYQYDNFNNVTWHKWPNGTEITYQYDGSGNLIEESGPLQYRKVYEVNSRGQTTQTTNHSLNIRSDYDAVNGILSRVYIPSLSIEALAEYDNVSRLTRIVNPNGSIDRFSYYQDDKLMKVVKDDNGLRLQTDYTYDENGNPTSIWDPNNGSTILTHDFNTDDLIKEQFGDNEKRWEYNDDGTLRLFKNKNGYEFHYSYYDEGNPAEGLLQEDGYARYIYDATTRRVETVEKLQNNSELSYEYDAAGRVNKIAYSPDGSNGEVLFGYNDANDKINKITIHNIPISYNYDQFNRPTQILWNTGANERLISNFEYQADGQLRAERLGNDVSVFYHYDLAGRLDSIWSKVNATNVLLHSVGCSFDKSGNRIRESYYVNTAIPGYNFQPLSYPSRFDYDQENRLTNIDGTRLYNDNCGNLLENQSESFLHAIYDSRDNLLSCTSYGTSFTYTYDALENRRSKNGNPFVLDLLSNGSILYSSSTKQYYIHSPMGLTCSIDSVTGQIKYYLYDFRGSTIAIVDENRNIIEHYQYDPFGNIEKSSVLPGSSTPFLYVGKYGVTYESSSLYYMRARFYDPQVGRFISEDPVWTTNLFPYANNNPLTNIDPHGTYVESAIDIASLAFNINDYRQNPSTLGALFIAADLLTTALPVFAGGGTFLRMLFVGGKATKTGVGRTVDFVSGVQTKSFGRVAGEGIVNVTPTINSIESGALRPRNNFGYLNREGHTLLNGKPAGYWQEYHLLDFGSKSPLRILRGGQGEYFLSPDHYKSIIPLNIR